MRSKDGKQWLMNEAGKQPPAEERGVSFSCTVLVTLRELRTDFE